MANIGRQGVYSPLPQAFSDSDSEKELQMESLNTTYTHQQPTNGIFRKRENHIPSNNIYKTSNYEDVKLKPGFYNMSTIRKFNFISSIFLCFLTIFVFLWVLPCDEGTCPVKIINWDHTHQNIEMKGNINMVRNNINQKENLAILFKHNINSVKDNSNGVILLNGNNGEVAWFISENEVPLHLNCYSIDVNQDNILDCIIVTGKYLKIIEPTSGWVIWSKQLIKITDSHPLVINDLNNDNIKDLLIVQNNNEVSLICSKSGVTLVSFVLKHCKYVKSELFVENNFLYLCHNKLKETFYKITQNTLSKIIVNNRTIIETLSVNYQRNDNEFSLNDRKLIITNEGVCPNCNVSVLLIDETTKKDILNWSFVNTYVMTPKTFSFGASQDNMSLLKGHVNGFILKSWQWTGQAKNILKSKILRNNTPVLNATVRIIKERIVLLTFNETNLHIINASSNEVNQICLSGNKNELIECQPDLDNQNDSMLITDLNVDNSLELVSYSSTFEYHLNVNEWRLVSNVKLIRLEAELPKLYETSK